MYCSTYNVVFGGQKITNGSLEMAYFPIEKQIDVYSASKTLAEKEVLSSHLHPLHPPSSTCSTPSLLRTVAIRPAAIYGPGEVFFSHFFEPPLDFLNCTLKKERHFPRIIDTFRNGLYKFTIGDRNNKVEWVYIDNLVYSLLLASHKLHQEHLQEQEEDTLQIEWKRKRVGGRAFPISDHHPINQFRFL